MIGKASIGSRPPTTRPRPSSRTYDGATYRQARQEWIDGGFPSEWAPYQRAAAEAGFIFPPKGSTWDSIEDAEPSQRAIVWRHITDRPAELLEFIGRSRSWSDVVDRIIGVYGRLREDADLLEREADYERAEGPTHRESVMGLAAVLRRIDDSRP